MKDLKKEFFEKYKDKVIRFREDDGSFSMSGYELWEWFEQKFLEERKKTLEEVKEELESLQTEEFEGEEEDYFVRKTEVEDIIYDKLSKLLKEGNENTRFYRS